MEQQLIAFGLLHALLLQAAAQQRDRLLMTSFADQQAAEFGAGIRVAGAGLQVRLHRLPQTVGLVGARQQLRAVAVMQDGRLAAVSDAPLRLFVQQFPDAVVDHRVIRPTPADGRVAAEQTADAGVGSHGGTQLVAQQVDHQHIGLGHQRFEAGDDFRPQLLVSVQHQHPVALEKLQGLIAGRGEVTGPVDPLHPGAGSLRDGDGGVGGARIHHHHLVSQSAHGCQAGRESGLLVAHDHREAEHRRWFAWREVKALSR